MKESKTVSRIINGILLPAAGEYEIDPVHSFAEFAVQHLVIGQVWGRFDAISGAIKIAEDPLSSSVDAAFDTASVSTHNEKRDADLRGPRFLDVAKYPRMTFHGIGIKAELGGRFTVDGNLNLRGVTRPVSLAAVFSGIVEDPWGKTRAAFRAKAKLNRRDFGLLADLERETGGWPVGKDVRIKIAIEAVLKSLK